MTVTLTATLVETVEPRPVQLVLAGTTAGSAYQVTGASGEQSWPVPGGQGVSTGAQVILYDNRSALNVPVVYSAVVDGVTYTSSAVTVASSSAFVLQSLDGQTVAALRPDPSSFAVQPLLRSHVSDVPGRSRPPVRFAPSGDGGGQFRLYAETTADSVALRQLLRTGRPLVYRCGRQLFDLPLVDIVMPIAGAVSDRVYADGSRWWSIPYLLVDDPEPSTVLSAWTWDDFDQAMASRTWTDFDAIFAGTTWDFFDTYNWGQL